MRISEKILLKKVNIYRIRTIVWKHWVTRRGPKQGSQQIRSTQQQTGTHTGCGGGQTGTGGGQTGTGGGQTGAGGQTGTGGRQQGFICWPKAMFCILIWCC